MLNHIVLMGRLTADPELRRTQNGTAVANFTLAVDRDYSPGEKQTDFISIVAWKSTAEFAQKWFQKGQLAVVSGRLQIRQYTDKDGNKRISPEVVADSIYFGESKKDRDEADYARAEKEGKDYKPAGAPVAVEADEEGELPF